MHWQGSTNQIARRPEQVTCNIGQVTNEKKSVRGLVPFFARASVINPQDANYMSMFIQPKIIFRSIIVACGKVIDSL